MDSQTASTRRARTPLALVRFSIMHPKLVAALWLLVCAFSVPGLLKLSVDTSTDSILDRGHPDWAAYQNSQALFGGDEIVVAALRGADPFDPRALDAIETLSAQLEGLAGVRRVDSIATVPAIRIDETGNLRLTSPLDDAPKHGQSRSLYVERLLRHDRIAPRLLTSPDARMLAINLILDHGTEGQHHEILQSVHRIVDPSGAIVSGVPVFRVAANDHTASEILFYAPITALLISTFLFATFRSIPTIAIGTAPGLIGSLILLSCMGYLGAPLSITTMVLPSIVIALGCAHSMHLLVAASERRHGAAHAVLLHTLSRIALPVALSGLTTAIGFVSITMIRIDAVRSTGTFGAIGVLVATAVSLTLLPAAISALPLPHCPPRGIGALRTRLAPRLTRWVERRQRLILAAWLGATIALAGGFASIDVETDATRWLPHGNPVRDSYEVIREGLSGISPINIVITAPPGDSVLQADALSAIAGLATHLERLPQVGRALSIADPLRQTAGAFSGDMTQPLPATQAEAEQYLLLLESVEQINDLIVSDRSAANIVIRADDNGSANLTAVGRAAETWWSENGPSAFVITPTGIMHEFARAEDAIAFGQVRGLAVAITTISAVLFAIFRWRRLALVALVPNALPLVAVFGIMGLAQVPLDAGTALIGSLALGVAVDDTVHIVSGYYDRIGTASCASDALLQAFQDSLPAITATTAMVGVAFLIFGFSEFSITRNLGLLTSGIMLLCYTADITLLPALLLRYCADSGHAASTPRGAHDITPPTP